MNTKKPTAICFAAWVAATLPFATFGQEEGGFGSGYGDIEIDGEMTAITTLSDFVGQLNKK